MARPMFTTAVENHDCPKCQQTKGNDCRTPKGRKAWPPHNQRIGCLTQKEVGDAMIVLSGLPI